MPTYPWSKVKKAYPGIFKGVKKKDIVALVKEESKIKNLNHAPLIFKDKAGKCQFVGMTYMDFPNDESIKIWGAEDDWPMELTTNPTIADINQLLSQKHLAAYDGPWMNKSGVVQDINKLLKAECWTEPDYDFSLEELIPHNVLLDKDMANLIAWGLGDGVGNPENIQHFINVIFWHPGSKRCKRGLYRKLKNGEIQIIPHAFAPVYELNHPKEWSDKIVVGHTMTIATEHWMDASGNKIGIVGEIKKRCPEMNSKIAMGEFPFQELDNLNLNLGQFKVVAQFNLLSVEEGHPNYKALILNSNITKQCSITRVKKYEENQYKIMEKVKVFPWKGSWDKTITKESTFHLWEIDGYKWIVPKHPFFADENGDEIDIDEAIKTHCPELFEQQKDWKDVWKDLMAASIS